ncbi:DUF7010 family protein [Flagellimonas zhangzhouensis]|uniref:DUF308 domain-containing protein n=1 Tax=Flagellimonas zhangzhouensis TaxID=1073328 RepID=A0A1H2UTB1_9FLAO|nr:hypothetical protein [Allomuricauda zhangzhouensis]SDQ14063.1 hypothetical protein SAMN05216294_0549 [Allomuricauda zhangzhouensis]SDW59168.1 hypothetical protein SAMN04487892_1743 [Allomuricauda zhangzhouensis]
MSENTHESIISNSDSINVAQSDLRKAYANGAFGVLASGLVWLAVSIVAHLVAPQTAVWSLFFGGMLIYPLGLILTKIMGVSAKHSKHNPLGKLIMEGTIFMLMCIPLALLLSLQNPAWFFQGMLLIIGGRYLSFSTLYGLKTYWILGGCLGLVAFGLFFLNAPSAVSALCGAVIELIFSCLLFQSYRKSQN